MASEAKVAGKESVGVAFRERQAERNAGQVFTGAPLDSAAALTRYARLEYTPQIVADADHKRRTDGDHDSEGCR